MKKLNLLYTNKQIEKYAHVISLGWFCSVSLETEKIGLRDCSGPFDWLLTSWNGVEECIENNFEDFLNDKYMKQYVNDPEFYVNTKLDFHFYHDFDKYVAYNNQIDKIKNKYKRRIDRFYKNIKEPTLFIRYIRDQKEANYLDANIVKVVELIKKYNNKNNILFISNNNIKCCNIVCYDVDKDKNDTVARTFLDKNSKLFNYLLSGIYDDNLRKINLIKYKNKIEVKRKSEIKIKIINKLKKNFLKPKIYKNQYDPKMH